LGPHPTLRPRRPSTAFLAAPESRPRKDGTLGFASTAGSASFKRNASISLGGRGAYVTLGTNDNRATVGAPGHVQRIGSPSAPAPSAPSSPPAPAPSAPHRRVAWVIGLLIGLAVLIAMLH
jgi:hypothetical protein